MGRAAIELSIVVASDRQPVATKNAVLCQKSIEWAFANF